jgi:hypothetical protein
MRLEVLMAVKMMMFFWVVMECSLKGRYQCFSENGGIDL